MASPDEDEMIYRGSVTFDIAVPLDAIASELADLLASGTVAALYVGSGPRRALTGVEGANDEDGWAWSETWHEIQWMQESIARRHGRTLHSAATYDSDERGSGTLVVDHGGRFHDCRDGEDPESHRTRACDCFPVSEPGDTLFAVAEVTDNDRVTIAEVPAGPFIDFPVICADHGDVACPTSRREAVFRREAHLVDAHTPSPLPLAAVPALAELPARVLDHIRQAADELLLGRSHAAPLAIRHRDAARHHTRQAESALRKHGPANTTALLIRALVELHAATPDREHPPGSQPNRP